MPIITPEFVQTRPATEIIDELRALLLSRRHREITRGQFMARYSELRKELGETPEWFDFRTAVIYRSGGQCERDGCYNNGAHVHHMIRISYNPRFALNVDTAEFLCENCHKSVDASHRKWMRDI